MAVILNNYANANKYSIPCEGELGVETRAVTHLEDLGSGKKPVSFLTPSVSWRPFIALNWEDFNEECIIHWQHVLQA